MSGMLQKKTKDSTEILSSALYYECPIGFVLFANFTIFTKSESIFEGIIFHKCTVRAA